MSSRDDRQKLAVQKWIATGCRSTIQWCTGAGKTRAAILAIKTFLTKNSEAVVKVIVPTEYLKMQWIQELNKYGLGFFVSVEIINSAIKVTTPIDLVVLDECHRMSATTFFEIFSQRKPKLVLGLSATFHRLDGRHELLNQYCPVCDVLSVHEAITNKWLSPYREYKVLIDPPDIEIYRQANAEFNDAFSVFNWDFNIAMSSMTNILFRRSYGRKMGLDPKTLDAISFTWGRALRARKAYVMDHPKKIEITRKILQARPDSKAITFSATIKQAEKIGIGYVVHSGKTKKKNRITMAEFANLSKGVVNTAKSLDEGVDITGLNLAIILCNTSSSQQKTQRVGRVIRYQEGKEAEIFTLVVRGTNEESWYASSNVGREFIEITEEELDDVLAGKPSENIVQTSVQPNLLFRL